MQESKRLNFLKSFLKLYGVENIELTNQTKNTISGIAIYDKDDIEERQEFIWHRTEKDVPPNELIILIEKIVTEKLHNRDKISERVKEIEFVELDNTTKEKMLDELFKVDIKMVDNGEETDSYFVHY